MKKFQLLRYFRAGWWLIAAISVIGGILFYSYIASTQTYKAQMTVAYTDPEAENGLNPDGSKLNAAEITSPAVLSMVVDKLGTDKSIDHICRDITIEEVIPEDIQAIQNGAWEDGLEYKYYATEYIITYETNDEQEARRTIEAILDCYITYYTEKYVAIPQAPNSVSAIKGLDSDYLEYAEVLEKFVNENRQYLINAETLWPKFRSSTTGYSFHDLYNEYNFIYTNNVPLLYSTILSNKVTRNAELLTYKYQYAIDKNNQRIQNNKEFIANTQGLIDAYISKNRDNMGYHWAADDKEKKAALEAEGGTQSAYGERYVIGQVYSFSNGDSVYEETTYDQLLNQYIGAQSIIAELETMNEYYTSFLNIFTGIKGENGAQYFGETNELIDWMIDRLTMLDELISRTTAEHTQSIGPQSIEMTASANVFQTKNVELYLLIALFLFFFVGFVCVIVIGRGLDFFDYMLYVDHSTNLPNRASCDAKIESYAGAPIPLDFTCITVSLDNIAEINRALGRDGGNQIMRIFASLLRDTIPETGFVGYNGSMRFMCLIPECDIRRSEYYQALFDKSVQEFNKSDAGGVNKDGGVSATTNSNKPMSIFELISETFKQLGGGAKRENADKGEAGSGNE